MSFANQSRGTLGRGKDAPGKSRESGLSLRAWKTRLERGFPTFPPPRRRALEEKMKNAEQKPLDAAAPFIDAPACALLPSSLRRGLRGGASAVDSHGQFVG